VAILPPGGWSESDTRVIITYQQTQSKDISSEDYIESEYEIALHSDPSVKKIEEHPSNLGKEPGHAIIYTGIDPSTKKNYYVLAIGSIVGNKGIIFWFIGFQPDFDNYLSTAKEIAKSFKIIKR